MSKSIAQVNIEQKLKYKTANNQHSDFPVGTRVQVICVAQDFSFFKGTETGEVIKNNGSYLGIIVKFDNEKLGEFNFNPDDLIKIDSPKRKIMVKYTVAFDCDGTLVTTDSAEKKQIVANERIRTLLITLASFKNIRIVVWSGGGEMWARQVGRHLGLDKYVWKYATKNYLGKDETGKHKFDPELTPDVAIDDIQDCELGVFNFIVKEK